MPGTVFSLSVVGGGFVGHKFQLRQCPIVLADERLGGVLGGFWQRGREIGKCSGDIPRHGDVNVAGGIIPIFNPK